jgi:hypothetical protein
MERILKAYLDGLGREEQKAVWVSGFFGSGKSHLVKMLRYLWTDYTFADGATARSLVRVPSEIADLLKELSTRSKPLGGLQAAAGTLGAGSMNNVRLAFIHRKTSPTPDSCSGCVQRDWKQWSPKHSKTLAAICGTKS